MAAKPKRQVTKARGHRASRPDFAAFYEGHELGGVRALPKGELPPWQREVLRYLTEGRDLGYIAQRIGVRQEDARRVVEALIDKGVWTETIPEVDVGDAPWDAVPSNA